MLEMSGCIVNASDGSRQGQIEMKHSQHTGNEYEFINDCNAWYLQFRGNTNKK